MIACLGWGSWIWDSRGLPLMDKWFEDGPLLQVEFARQSADGRLTLVLVPAGAQVRCLWAPFSVGTLAEAQKALGKREGISDKNRDRWIAVWSTALQPDPAPPAIVAWARRLGLTALVWTNLPPKFGDEEGRVPTVDEAVQYLRDLPHEQRRKAERYVEWPRGRWTRRIVDGLSSSLAGLRAQCREPLRFTDSEPKFRPLAERGRWTERWASAEVSCAC